MAVIANLAFADGHKIRGVGYLEAKKKDRVSNKFSAIKIPQIQRISRNARRSLLLLYSHDRITGFRPVPPFLDEWLRWSLGRISTRFSHAICLPTDLFLSVKSKDTSLYKFGSTLACQIAYRFLYGLDLHYETADWEEAALFEEAQGAPNFVLSLSVTHGNIELGEPVTPAGYAEIVEG